MSGHGICGANNPNCNQENPNCEYYDEGMTEDEEIDKAMEEKV